jgi:hypothetical protein
MEYLLLLLASFYFNPLFSSFLKVQMLHKFIMLIHVYYSLARRKISTQESNRRDRSRGARRSFLHRRVWRMTR